LRVTPVNHSAILLIGHRLATPLMRSAHRQDQANALEFDSLR